MKLYVINLERSTDRLEHITQIFYEQGLVFERVEAVDGRALDENEFCRLVAASRWEKKLTKTEVGCYLSHRECLRRIATGDDAYGAVFEDDIVISVNAKFFLKAENWIPESVDIVKLDTSGKACLLGNPQTRLPNGYILKQLLSKHYGAGGYIISRACAIRLLEQMHSVEAPIDELYYNPACSFFKTLCIAQINPAIVGHIGMESTIRQEQKQKQRSPSKMPFYKKIIREIKRANRKNMVLARLKGIGRVAWNTVPFR